MEKEGGEKYNLCKVRVNNSQGASLNVLCQLKKEKMEERCTNSAAEDKLLVNRQHKSNYMYK